MHIQILVAAQSGCDMCLHIFPFKDKTKAELKLTEVNLFVETFLFLWKQETLWAIVIQNNRKEKTRI